MRTASEVLRSLEARIARLEGRTASSKRNAYPDHLWEPGLDSYYEEEDDNTIKGSPEYHNEYVLYFDLALVKEDRTLSDDELEKKLRASVKGLTKIYGKKVNIEDYRKRERSLSCVIRNLDLQSVNRIVTSEGVGDKERELGLYTTGRWLYDDKSGRSLGYDEEDELVDYLERWA